MYTPLSNVSFPRALPKSSGPSTLPCLFISTMYFCQANKQDHIAVLLGCYPSRPSIFPWLKYTRSVAGGKLEKGAVPIGAYVLLSHSRLSVSLLQAHPSDRNWIGIYCQVAAAAAVAAFGR